MNYKIFYRAKWFWLFTSSVFLALFIKIKKVTAKEETTNFLTSRPDYSNNSVLLVAGIFLLMFALFWFLFFWSNRLDQTSYLGTLYQDSIRDTEYKRLKRDISDKWKNREYHREVLQDLDWIESKEKKDSKDNNMPQVPQDLPLKLKENAYSISNRYKSQLGIAPTEDISIPNPNPPSYYVRSDVRREVNPNSSHEEPSPQEQERFDQFVQDIYQWALKVHQEAQTRYGKAEIKALEDSEERAKKAVNVNWSALRGKGTEFVLEFTTVVVIIFAAVILGILGILDTQQIGTLLAAIAGYVLGRATTRSQNEAEEVKKSQTVAE